MKNLLEKEVRDEILNRIDKVNTQSKAVWGKMNAAQCLRHINMSLQIPVGELDPTLVNPPPIPKWLMKFLLLNTKPPKGGAETFKEINMVANNINPSDMEEEKKNLKAQINRFFDTPELIPANKLGGKFSRSDWGKLNYNHADHHLRQIGV